MIHFVNIHHFMHICQEFILQYQLKVTVGDVHSIFTSIKELYEPQRSLIINKKGTENLSPKLS